MTASVACFTLGAAKHWQSFLKIFADGAKAAAIDRGLANIRQAAVDAGLPDAELVKIERFLQASKDIFGQ